MLNDFNYKNTQLEEIPCNLCGKNIFFVLAKKTANDLLVRACLCKNCGLIYISPRMPKVVYSEYCKYFYHKVRAAQKGISLDDVSLENDFENAKKFGIALAKNLSGFIDKDGFVLDVGSSTGGVLAGFKQILPDIEPMGIEPSFKEAEFANSRGIQSENTIFEKWLNRGKVVFSSILCIQSLNHLLDPRTFLERSYDNLKTGGHLVLVVKNFREQCRRASSAAAALQPDHLFMFTPETLSFFVEAVGFEVIYIDVDEHKNEIERAKNGEKDLRRHHIRLVARKTQLKKTGAELSNKAIYRKLRWQLSKYCLKVHYLFHYSKKVKKLLKF